MGLFASDPIELSLLHINMFHYSERICAKILKTILRTQISAEMENTISAKQLNDLFFPWCNKTAIESKESGQITNILSITPKWCSGDKEERALAMDSQLNPEKQL